MTGAGIFQGNFYRPKKEGRELRCYQHREPRDRTMTDATKKDRDPVTGRFAPGNELWRIVADRLGRPLKFETPDVLWGHCVEYFEWVEAHPPL
jgi:hypothetical protein